MEVINAEVKNAELMSALKSEGYTIYPKRDLKVPEIDPSRLQALGERVGYKVDFLREFVTDYLPVGDDLGNNEKERHQKLEDIKEKYGDEAYELVHEKNQFRGNNLSAMALGAYSIMDAALKAGHPDVADQISEIQDQMFTTLRGDKNNPESKDYNQVTDINKKLDIVHEFEDGAVQILNMVDRIV